MKKTFEYFKSINLFYLLVLQKNHRAHNFTTTKKQQEKSSDPRVARGSWPSDPTRPAGSAFPTRPDPTRPTGPNFGPDPTRPVGRVGSGRGSGDPCATLV